MKKILIIFLAFFSSCQNAKWPAEDETFSDVQPFEGRLLKRGEVLALKRILCTREDWKDSRVIEPKEYKGYTYLNLFTKDNKDFIELNIYYGKENHKCLRIRVGHAISISIIDISQANNGIEFKLRANLNNGNYKDFSIKNLDIITIKD